MTRPALYQKRSTEAMTRYGLFSFISVVLFAFVVVTGCDSTGSGDGPDVVDGPSVSVDGGGSAYAWVRLDGDDQPEAVGVSLSESAFRAITDTSDAHTNWSSPKHGEPASLVLDLPDEAPPPYDHATIDWIPEGHPPPGIYTVPHFDAHFYFVSKQTRQSVQPGPAQVFPDERYVPEGYVPDSVNTPSMGMHYLNMQAPEFNGEPFTHTLIYGFDEGEHAFIEPMVTREVLSSGPDVEAEVPQPDVYQKAGMYPRQYRIIHDSDAGEYRVVLEELVRHAGS